MADNPETKATETTEAQPNTTEQTPEAKPAESQPATEAKPAAVTKPAATEQAPETKPVDTKPATETKPAEPDYKAQAADYAARVVRAEAKAALVAMGVPAARLYAALKIADLNGIDPNDAKAGEKIAAAAAKVLEIVPEFKGGAGTGSAVATPRKSGGELDDFQRGYLGTK